MDTRPALTASTEGDWSLAESLPSAFSDAWRDPERWHRLALARARGERYLELPALITPTAATAIRDAVMALAWQPLETTLLHAKRCLLGAGDVSVWLDAMQHPAFRALVSAALGREMPAGLVVNAWRLARGDHMGVHPDGRLYFGTLSLGLCDTWSPADGGAIAFGELQGPDGQHLDVRQRWWPRLGDACLFAPAADTWHAVEPVTSVNAIRYSLTGWWVLPEDGLTRSADASREHP